MADENKRATPFHWGDNVRAGKGIFGYNEGGLGSNVFRWWKDKNKEWKEKDITGPLKFGSGWWDDLFSGDNIRSIVSKIADNRVKGAENQEAELLAESSDNSLLDMAKRNYMEKLSSELMGNQEPYTFNLFNNSGLKRGDY